LKGTGGVKAPTAYLFIKKESQTALPEASSGYKEMQKEEEYQCKAVNKSRFFTHSCIR
jgi:hypothetical protein